VLCLSLSLSLRVRARARERNQKCGCVFVMARTLYRRSNAACLENCMRPDAARHLATKGYVYMDTHKNCATRYHHSTHVYAMTHV